MSVDRDGGRIERAKKKAGKDLQTVFCFRQ